MSLTHCWAFLVIVFLETGDQKQLPLEELVRKNLLHEYQLQVQAGECEGIVLNCNMCHVLTINHKKAARLQAA